MMFFFLKIPFWKNNISILYTWFLMWSLIIEVLLWPGVRKIMFLIFDPIICFESKNNTNVPYEFQLVTECSLDLLRYSNSHCLPTPIEIYAANERHTPRKLWSGQKVLASAAVGDIFCAHLNFNSWSLCKSKGAACWRGNVLSFYSVRGKFRDFFTKHFPEER